MGLSSIQCVPIFGETDFVFGETVPVFGETVFVFGDTVPFGETVLVSAVRLSQYKPEGVDSLPCNQCFYYPKMRHYRQTVLIGLK